MPAHFRGTDESKRGTQEPVFWLTLEPILISRKPIDGPETNLDRG